MPRLKTILICSRYLLNHQGMDKLNKLFGGLIINQAINILSSSAKQSIVNKVAYKLLQIQLSPTVTFIM